MRAPHVCFVITEDWYFWSHRRSLAQSLIQRGCRVDLVTNLDAMKSRIEAMGVIAHSVGLQRRGKNPMFEASTVHRMTKLFQQLRPDITHLVGMKPILYGSLAATLANVPATVCALAGLGWLFTRGGLLKASARGTVQTYCRRALANKSNVRFIVQNSQHRELLIESRMSAADQVDLISGAGVDTNRFAFQPESTSTPVVLTHARMLWDKGIGDLVEAARLIRKRNLNCKFMLVGDPDPANPAAIPYSQLEQWNKEGVVHWQARRDDISDLLAQSHIACLPSHHEGFPLSLVEALSVGRAVVTTDIPGCRDVVQHNETGLLVPKQDAEALADALAQLIQNAQRRQQMGRNGRQQVMRRMSCRIVNDQTYSCYQRALQNSDEREAAVQPAKRAA